MKSKRLKILYAVQGTGNGHITRAIEIIPFLKEKGEVDILVSGIQSDIGLPYDIKYKLTGMSFIFGKQGGVDIWKTYRKLNSRQLLKDINAIPIREYDIIISDFEPISCWAAMKAKKDCIGLSNQVATLHPMAPKPKHNDIIGKFILHNYAPTTYNYGFHFKRLGENIFTPIIRSEVREVKVTNKGHYTVYLPAYDDKRIIKNLEIYNRVTWQVFSKHNKEKRTYDNITVMPIDKDLFLESMASSAGVLCNAGFGTVSEALFLKKKLMVIPMKKQVEQHYNAEMLKEMGVPVMKSLKRKHIPKLTRWLNNKEIVIVDYPDDTQKIVDAIFENHAGKKHLDTHFESNHYTLFQ